MRGGARNRDGHLGRVEPQAKPDIAVILLRRTNAEGMLRRECRACVRRSARGNTSMSGFACGSAPAHD
jgi:hypothetical protein